MGPKKPSDRLARSSLAAFGATIFSTLHNKTATNAAVRLPAQNSQIGGSAVSERLAKSSPIVPIALV